MCARDVFIIPRCACGCGKFVKQITKTQISLGRIKGEFNSYVHGHNKNRLGTVHTKESIDKMVIVHTGFQHSKRTKEKIKAIALANGYGKWMLGKICPEEIKFKIAQSMKGKNKQEKTLDHKKKLSVVRSNLWKESSYVSKQMKARGVKKNKKETLLEKILYDLCPDEWEFVGDGKMIINGKCPDFININGQKKIIELFGDYWHRNDDPQDRINCFKPFGFDTLVIWERELKDIENVKLKINTFVRKT